MMPSILVDRVVGKVRTNGDCWEWTAHRNRDGYGRVRVAGATRYAHRVLYEQLVGPVADGLELDHLCRNRSCVNPDHLEQVTHAENVRRSQTWLGARGVALSRSACRSGHEYTSENTRVYRGRRNCRACGRARSAATRARTKGEGLA